MEYNLYLEERAKNTYFLHLTPPPKNAKTGIAIKWPVDPEFTGVNGIISMLSELEHCKNWVFINN